MLRVDQTDPVIPRWTVLLLALTPAWVWGETLAFSGSEVSPGDPVVLQGDYHPPASPRQPLLLMFHGLGSSAREWGPLAQLAQQLGWGTLAFDARGHGRSDRTAKGGWVHLEELKSTLGRDMVEDGVKVLEALQRNTKTKNYPLVLVGASLGANVALKASQGRLEVRGLVLLSPGLNYAGVTTEDLAPRTTPPVLLLAARPDSYAFDSIITLGRLRPDWTSWKLLQGTPQGAHGVQLFNGQLEKDILNWIQKHLGQ